MSSRATRIVRRGLLSLGLCIVTAVAAPSLASAAAAPGDIGFQSGTFGSSGSPTGSKPQSKLWFNDGIWWSDMMVAGGSAHRIHRLNRATQTWEDTGTATDPRGSSRSDVLWDGAAGKLYVASHPFVERASAGEGARLYRYSYNAASKTYSLDGGFPVSINGANTETLVIDKDSLGRLWATWMMGSKVTVAHTDGNDASWGTPYVIPGTASASGDDISSLIAFGGNKIGVLWSNESTDQMLFGIHQDGAGDGVWTVEAIPTSYSADDHINLKASAAGEIFAATKTSEDDGQPMILLNKRSVSGTWTTAVYGVKPQHTRPIVLLDEAAREVHVLASCARSNGGSGQSGGDICEKVTPMAGPAFAPGPGTAVLRDLSSFDINNVTSTKQNLSSATGIVVQASNDTTREYWHSDRPLTSAPLPDAPRAAFSSSPPAGPAPLDVRFTDSSTGPVTSWSWNFGDGTSSSQRNPSHRFTTPGTYAVRLTVSDSFSRTSTSTGTVVVSGPDGLPAGGGGGEGAAGGGVGPGGPGAGTGGSGATGAGGGAGGGLPVGGAGAVTGGVTSIALKSDRIRVPYGQSVVVRAKLTGEGVEGTTVRLLGAKAPFLSGLSDVLAPLRATAAGTVRFRTPVIRGSMQVVAVTDGGLRSSVITLVSAARPTITRVRRSGGRIVVTGRVAPVTRSGRVTLLRRAGKDRYRAKGTASLRKDGTFRLTMPASSHPLRLRVRADPRDGGKRVVGTSSARALSAPRR